MPFDVRATTATPALPQVVGDSIGALELASRATGDNYHCPQGTVARNDNWRIDRQKPSVTHANIQIQRNGVDRPSTVACVIVPLSYSDDISAVGLPDLRLSMVKELGRAINMGLHLSERSRWKDSKKQLHIMIFEVTGAFSSARLRARNNRKFRSGD
jgi:hypothetical protein